MSEIKLLLGLFLAISIASIFLLKKYLKRSQPKSYNYTRRFGKTVETEKPRQKFEFRKKENELPKDSYYNFREAFKQASEKQFNRSNYHLSKTFWIILIILIILTLAFFEFDSSFLGF